VTLSSDLQRQHAQQAGGGAGRRGLYLPPEALPSTLVPSGLGPYSGAPRQGGYRERGRRQRPGNRLVPRSGSLRDLQQQQQMMDVEVAVPLPIPNLTPAGSVASSVTSGSTQVL
jgi:hypothetical protein